MDSLGQFIHVLFEPLSVVFHYAVYLPVFNALVALDEEIHAVLPALPAYPIAILLLGLLVQAALTPVTRRQMRGSMAMQRLAPRLRELQRRYRGQPQELMAAQQALYRTQGISMYGGCLPLLLQLPLLLGVYSASQAVLLTQPGETAARHLARVNSEIYPFISHLNALPGTTFLWLNLAAPDHLLMLPLLAALCSFLQLRLARLRGERAARGTHGALGPIQALPLTEVIMPPVWFFVCLTITSGVSLYLALWIAANLVQQAFVTSIPPPVDMAPDAQFVL